MIAHGLISVHYFYVLVIYMIVIKQEIYFIIGLVNILLSMLFFSLSHVGQSWIPTYTISLPNSLFMRSYAN
jgi:hypothetical protein